MSMHLLESALALDPTNVVALELKGRTSEERGDWIVALRAYKTMADIDRCAGSALHETKTKHALHVL
jgi:cytochrome c-type biogenesis protein CcmH/NrfG